MSRFVANLQNEEPRRTLHRVWIRTHEAKNTPLICVWIDPTQEGHQGSARRPVFVLSARDVAALVSDNEPHRRERQEGLRRAFVLSVAAVLLACVVFPRFVSAQTTGKISAVVRDQTGGVIPSVPVALRNVATGIEQTVVSDATGTFTFTAVPVGQYELQVNLDGFRPYRRSGLTVDVNTALQFEITLQLGERSQTLEVTESDVRVQTAETALGETISGRRVSAMPLNGRSYTDLLALQAGVTPIATNTNPNASSGGAFGTIAPSGGLNAGQFSITGQRETANGFILNGVNVQEGIASAAAIVPNLDSIAEFRILTTSFDAEYGNYSGGLINVITKSGANQIHGSGFEFFRNTLLDARGFFDPTRAQFNQNQYGGTLGGPIRPQKAFFFGEYQGSRTVQGIPTGILPVPSLRNRTGDLSDQAQSLVPQPNSPVGTVQGAYLATLLSERLGYAVAPGEPYYTPGCTRSAECVFPDAVIPQRAWSVPAQRLLHYIPLPNLGINSFSTSKQKQRLNDSKGSARVDANTARFGTLSAYYFIDDYNLNNPYPTAQGGANVPGFNALGNGRAQLITLADTKAFGTQMVNELRIGYLRNANRLGQAQGGVGVSLVSQGFLPPSAGGLVPGFPKYLGVEPVVFNKLTLGTTPFAILQINNTYQVSDNFSKVVGNHSVKFGGQFHLERVKQDVNLLANGEFEFFGDQTGLDFADFLIGTPSVYSQQFSPQFGNISKYAALYAQDSWRIRPNLTLNYGVRWDWIRPWSEEHSQTSTLIAGQNSKAFPGAPSGYVFPGDPGIPSTIAPAPADNFSPRIALAYSPGRASGFWSKLTGGPGKSSVRLGFGRFFTAIEGLTVAYPTGNPPYGLTYVSPERPLFEAPFVGVQTGNQFPQQFPVNVPPYSVSAQNPFLTDWSRYTPINGAVSYYFKNPTPYSENYFLSLERQLGAGTVLTLSYIGSQGHHLLTLLSANPGDPALCLSVSRPEQVAPGSPTCGPFGENGVYTRSDGTAINGTRRPFDNNIGSDAYFYNYGNSSYNSLQVTLNHSSKRLSVLGSYTYGKSLDLSSSIQEQLDPYDYRLRRAISSFDLRHSFVASYRYALPVEQLLGRRNRLTEGWAVSGITRLSTGVPVTFFDFNDNSLVGSQNQGVNGIGSDQPDFNPGALEINHNPRNGRPYFNTSLFSNPALGTPGTSPRRFFYGPGMVNFDLSLLKGLRLSESKSLELRLETFNTFNHAQFFGANSVDGNINSSTFGRVVSAASPRIAQLAVKLLF